MELSADESFNILSNILLLYQDDDLEVKKLDKTDTSKLDVPENNSDEGTKMMNNGDTV